MASRAMKPLTRGAAVDLANRAAAGKALAPVLMTSASTGIEGTEEFPFNTVVSYLVYVRQGGFMVVFPGHDNLVAFLAEAVRDIDPDGVLSRPVEIEVETPRGRGLGTTSGVLVDLPWAAVSKFVTGTTFRAASLQGVQALQFVVSETLARPNKESAYQAADEWIVDTMPPESAQDYLTGEELEEEAEAGQPVMGSQQTGDQEEMVAALQDRIIQLELQLKGAQHRPTALHSGVPMVPASKAPPLFPDYVNTEMTPAAWARLQSLAGSPPPRVGAAETRRGIPNPTLATQDGVLAGMEKEVEELGDSELALQALQDTADGSSPDLAKVMLAQLQQNALMIKKMMAPKHSDPVLSALAGSSGGDSASGSSGVRGCMAREVYIRSMQDLPRVAAIAQENAMKELGISQARVDENLMRKYLERKMILADHRLLGYFGFMMSEAWAVGWKSRNEELLGVVAKAMFFIEQAGLDAGKTKLAWLLTGHPEPPFNLFLSSRQRTGLEPFSRLCAPAWVSANLAYVKDLDVLESKMLTMGKPAKKATDAEEEEPPKRKPPKKGGKDKGKGNDRNAADEAA